MFDKNLATKKYVSSNVKENCCVRFTRKMAESINALQQNGFMGGCFEN